MKLRDKPCSVCQWKFPGFHVCVDLSTPEPRIKQVKRAKRASYHLSPAGLEGLTEGQRARRAKERAMNEERDAELVRRYQVGDVGMRTLANEFEMSYTAVLDVMHRAASLGEVVVRKRGGNNRFSKKVE